jgi:hypothetical protein
MDSLEGLLNGAFWALFRLAVHDARDLSTGWRDASVR